MTNALQASPSDAALRGTSNAQLIKLAVRCLPIDGQTYCLHRGWEDSAASAANDVRTAQAAAEAVTPDATLTGSEGDMSLLTYLRNWSKLSYAKRVAQENTELKQAVAAAGKEVFYTDVVFNHQPLPSNFVTAFPALASWVPLAKTILTQAKAKAAVSPDSVPDPPVSNHYTSMSTSKMKKQEKGNWCGPTSLQALVWNSPSNGNYQTQTYWAGKLGVTDAGTSTYIGDLNTDINTYTTWDSSSYAGTYAVHSISSWTVDQWESLFGTHLGSQHAPVQLHPILNSSDNDYYPTHTSGHFDVGRGYDLDYPGDGGTTADKVYLFEPAGGPAEGNVYTSVTATDTFEDIKKANLANTTWQDIAY